MSAKIPKLSRLSRNVWRVLGCNPSAMTLQGTNVYLIGRGDKRILIDAGPAGFPEYIASIHKLLKQERVKVNHILLTHWHKDHVSGLQDLLPVFKDLGELPVVHKFPRIDKPDNPFPSEYETSTLEDGQSFAIDGHKLTAMYTPGHATDHATIHYREESSVFCGDCLLGEGTGLFEDLFDYIASLRKIQALKPYKIYPGHGPTIDDTAEKLQYNIDHQLSREKRVFGVLQENFPQPLLPGDIVAQIYKGLSPGLQQQATANINHHLKKLVKENRVLEIQGKYSVTGGL